MSGSELAVPPPARDRAGLDVTLVAPQDPGSHCSSSQHQAGPVSSKSRSKESFLVCRESPPVYPGSFTQENGRHSGQGFGEQVEEVGHGRSGRRAVERSGESGEHDELQD